MTDITLENPMHKRRPPTMGTNASFWDKIADTYAASPIKNMAAYEQTLDRVRSYLTREHNVLEVGCGTGTTALTLGPEVGHLTASDISKRMIEIAEQKAQDQGADNVSFRQAPLPDPSLTPQSYDTILCFNTLHLLPNLPEALNGLSTALKPGGLFISKTVCLAEQTRLWGIPIALMRLIGKAPYVKLLTFRDIERVIEAAGFTIIEIGTYPQPFSRFIVAQKIQS